MKWFSLSCLVVGILCLSACGRARAGKASPLQGVVEYDERTLAFEVSGRVVDVSVQRGGQVATGAVLARLDDALQKSVREMRAADVRLADAQLRLLRAGARGEELRAAESEVAALEAQASILQKDLVRQRALQEGMAVAQSVVDKTAGELQAVVDKRRALDARLNALRSGARGEEIAAAVARLDRAEAALAAEDVRLTQHQLHAVASGSVVDVHVKPGEVVSAGTPVATVADLSHPYVEAFVPQGRADRLRIGRTVSVAVDSLDAPLRGRIEHVFRKLEFTPRFLFSASERPNLVLRIHVRVEDAAHRLHSGLPAFVSL